MFNNSNDKSLEEVFEALRKNEILITAKGSSKKLAPHASKFGGFPSVPTDFAWPRYKAENLDGEFGDRPLSFLCQINLEEISAFDKESLLPHKGMLLFFYEQDSFRWGFSPDDKGCARVYYFEDVSVLVPLAPPEDLKDEFKVIEFNLSFKSRDSYPSFEEASLHPEVELDWDDWDEYLENCGYGLECERHKLLGFADLIQSEMLTECERTSRGIDCGEPESYDNIPEEVKEDIKKVATDWILLFQMASIEYKDFELMFGDVGNLYFYIRKQDLKDRNFSNIWLILQCG